jgi:hypothetical protein
MITTTSSSIVFRKFGRILGFIFLTGCIVAILYSFCLSLFQLQTIEVIGEGIRLDIDRSKIEKNLLFIRTNAIEQSLLASNNQLEKVTITKIYPHTLHITVELRKPVARVRGQQSTFLIDERAVVLGYSKAAYDSLPLIILPIPDQMDGTTIKNDALMSCIEIIKTAGIAVPISSITMHETSSLRATYEKTSIFFPLKGDFSASAATLQTLITRFRMKGSMPASIDLRFDKPVIRM